MGIQPDIIVCRSEHPLDQGLKDKIALFCNVPSDHVLQNLDVEYLYEAPLAMEKKIWQRLPVILFIFHVRSRI